MIISTDKSFNYDKEQEHSYPNTPPGYSEPQNLYKFI